MNGNTGGNVRQVRTTRFGEPEQLRMVLEEPPKKRGVPWFWLVTACLVLLSFAAVYMRNDLANAFKPTPGTAQPLATHQVQVIDGDTIRVRGHDRDINLVGFSTPETARAHCDVERERGYAAMRRLRAIIESAQLELQSVSCGCAPGTEGTRACNDGRRCGILRANGWDVGERLIAEGFAVRYACSGANCPPPRRPWCEVPR
jgi:endonuclease YncB( thermonuclease family)